MSKLPVNRPVINALNEGPRDRTGKPIPGWVTCPVCEYTTTDAPGSPCRRCAAEASADTPPIS